ncbi:uncharacterized protein DUF3693 [Idiomarina aquatica]|uniref:Uncharacterized protein DUF3693 n=1 Tax=Idiomarina aquatica TaxID=1327752 RepID=A0A4R6PRX3_9GAMM|nr:DUF3693 domain-containing protein [Idiomarina aquatica]TDP40704.1 uncharacterized protein DUF3693 [Idiomarina aquatica]
MSYSQELIEQAQKSGLKIIEIAEIIGSSQPWVSRVKRENKRLTEEQVIKLAEQLGLDTDRELIKLQIETAKTEKERAIWVKLLNTLIATSAFVSASAKAVITNCVECILC